MSCRKVVIIDDEPIICNLIKRLGEWDRLNLEIVGSATDGLEGYRLIRELHPDIVLLDIRMPGLDGNKSVLKLREYNRAAILVFCSGYFEPTSDSINIGQPFRYIMKDLHDRSLKREIPAILSKVKLHCGDSSVTVTSAGRVIRIYTEDILYICLAKRGCSIYVARQGEIDEMHCKESLGDLYERLAGRGFEYAHNSYIVNLAKVEGLEKNVALLQMGIQLNVSRSRKGQFADALIMFLGERNGMV